jgi:superfamily II DNA or RNA helicase
MASTSLGLRGYAILKSALEPSEQMQIRKDLLMQPNAPKAPVQPDPFPIYVENATTLFVPRYYGLETYGDPEEMCIHDGADTTQQMRFAGELRDYQNVIVDKYVAHVRCGASGGRGGGGGCLDVDPGKGKTVMALKIMSILKTRTLVVVHKTFLVNQWLERIRQFLPDARVGRIQGREVDIENKDIVIGMLQSLSMKDYDDETFSDFGLTVFDECHHMSAEVFCRCMIKITTRYTLGLSGTMTRKDGLTKVFKMFLGEIIHKEKSEQRHNVIVKGIQYYIADNEFNEVETDYRGNPKFSTMITKLCNYGRRSDFILDVLRRELEQNESQQVMILAHNKSLLSYFHDAIQHRNIGGGSVGFYVGGMKEADLKASESKKIIIATYAMASEGLDIPTLTTLLMATPKTDVCQSVGRILRTKHTSPLVIDIIDYHDIFCNQWMKRQAYYAKQGYHIMYTNNSKYFKDEWKTRDAPSISAPVPAPAQARLLVPAKVKPKSSTLAPSFVKHPFASLMTAAAATTPSSASARTRAVTTLTDFFEAAPTPRKCSIEL